MRSRDDQWIVGQANTEGANTLWARLQIGKLAIDDLGISQRVSLVIPRSGTAVSDLVLTDTTPAQTDQWMLYSAVVSGSSDGISTAARLYRNKQLVAEQTVDGVYENPSVSDRFFVGGVEQADAYDGGLIDDVRIYGGPLSAVNVQELFEEGGFTP